MKKLYIAKGVASILRPYEIKQVRKNKVYERILNGWIR